MSIHGDYRPREVGHYQINQSQASRPQSPQTSATEKLDNPTPKRTSQSKETASAKNVSGEKVKEGKLSKMETIGSFIGGILLGAGLVAAALTPVGWAIGACVITAGACMILSAMMSADKGAGKYALLSGLIGGIVGAAGLLGGAAALGGVSVGLSGVNVAGASVALSNMGSTFVAAVGGNIVLPVLVTGITFIGSMGVGMYNSPEERAERKAEEQRFIKQWNPNGKSLERAKRNHENHLRQQQAIFEAGYRPRWTPTGE